MSGKVCPRGPDLGHFGHQNRKKAVQRNFKKWLKNQLPKNTEFLKTGVRFFWFLDTLFSTFSDPEPTWPPKPQKVRKRSPKGHQNDPRNLKNNTEIQKNGCKLANEIVLHLIFTNSFRRNPARRNARSALNNRIHIIFCNFLQNELISWTN